MYTSVHMLGNKICSVITRKSVSAVARENWEKWKGGCRSRGNRHWGRNRRGSPSVPLFLAFFHVIRLVRMRNTRSPTARRLPRERRTVWCFQIRLFNNSQLLYIYSWRVLSVTRLARSRFVDRRASSRGSVRRGRVFSGLRLRFSSPFRLQRWCR